MNILAKTKSGKEIESVLVDNLTAYSPMVKWNGEIGRLKTIGGVDSIVFSSTDSKVALLEYLGVEMSLEKIKKIDQFAVATVTPWRSIRKELIDAEAKKEAEAYAIRSKAVEEMRQAELALKYEVQFRQAKFKNEPVFIDTWTDIQQGRNCEYYNTTTRFAMPDGTIKSENSSLKMD